MLCLFHKFIFSEIFETRGEEIQEATSIQQPATSNQQPATSNQHPASASSIKHPV